MSKQKISIINGVEIYAEITENGQILIPVKPICMVLTVDHPAQIQRIKRHRKLSSTMVVITTVAEDGKAREMVCLPLKYVYGWLFSIDLSMVSKDALPKVEQYQDECYEILYQHFTGSMQRTIETNNTEIELLSQINTAISDEKEAKIRRKKAEEALDKLRAERLKPQPSLF